MKGVTPWGRHQGIKMNSQRLRLIFYVTSAVIIVFVVMMLVP